MWLYTNLKSYPSEWSVALFILAVLIKKYFKNHTIEEDQGILQNIYVDNVILTTLDKNKIWTNFIF